MLRNGQIVMLLTAALLAFGVVMVNSAALDLGGQTSLMDLLASRQSGLAVAAFICLLAGSLIPVERLAPTPGRRSPAPWLLAVVVVALLAVYVPGLGREVNGARRWLQLGPIGLQPSEIAKWMVPVVVAWYCCDRAARMREFTIGFALPCGVVGGICGMIALHDLGTAVLIMVVAIAMLVAGGARILYPMLIAPVLLAAAALLIVVSPYRVNRILAYLDPYADSQGIGYHVVQSMAAISGGGLAGRGLGNSIQKFGYLPEATTDFIYAIVSEELGLVGALAVGALYAVLLLTGWAILRTARTRPDGSRQLLLPAFGQLLGFGILLTIGVQAVMNIFVVTGLAPTKGIALPLISHGGTGWLLTGCSLGFLVGMERRALKAHAIHAPEALATAPEPHPPVAESGDQGGTPALSG